jgi:hypothetical protein
MPTARPPDGGLRLNYGAPRNLAEKREACCKFASKTRASVCERLTGVETVAQTERRTATPPI